jgi:Carboxypeptidase regulatory-like domain/TonB dependent receptor
MTRVRLVTTAFLVLICVNVSAQTITGSLSGTILDTSGRVVPGADVVIVHEQTGEERRTVSSDAGEFTFPGLLPGPYTLRVRLEGFKPLEVKGNVVLANSRVALGSLHLELGALTESVTVTALGETLDLTRTSHEAVLDVQQMASLTIRGRDPISLLKILPGVSLRQAGEQEAFGGSFATPVPNIQGGRGQTIYVDGINGGDGGGSGGGGGNFSGATNLDAIAEVNVQLSAYTAEYGLKGGAQVNFITKRGGSEYKGTLYTNQRDKRFNATNYFNKIAGLPKPEYRYSNLGGTLGGPVPKVPGINPEGDKLFFFYSIDDTQSKNPQQLRRWNVPTAAERRGDFSQSRTPAGGLIPIRDPLTGQPFPNNIIPLERADPRGLAFLNMIPLPNAAGSGYNMLTQEDSIPQPRRQHLLRVDYRPTPRDTFSVKGQTWYTKSVGYNVSAASSRWHLIRQRYDFTADQAKVDYTKVLGSHTVFEANAGVFDSHEDGPPENDEQLAILQRRSYPALAALPQFSAIHNPYGLIPRVTWGTVQSSGNGDWNPSITYDGRWPLTGHDSAIAVSMSLTHTRGKHTFKMGLLRERENFGQARSGTFAGEISFGNDTNNPNNAGYGFANAFLGQITSYTESMGRPGDNRRQTTYAWYAQDTWRPHPRVTLDLGLRMYNSDLPRHVVGESSAFTFERFDPKWGGKPPVLFRPVLVAGARRALNPLTGEVLPSTYIGQMVPGTGYTCGVITPGNPCKINGVVSQVDPDYVEGDGFFDPLGLQYDPRAGLAWAMNSRTVLRVAGGSYHEGTGGFYQTGGAAWRFDRVIRFTDFNSYLTGTSTTAPVSVSGVERSNQKRPVTYRFTLGVQRDLGWKTVLDLAYVGDRTKYIAQNWNYNAVPAGAQFLPENRDTTVTATAANPGALPDAFLRPITGFLDINISGPHGTGKYDSLQMQLSRRFTGGVELAGSYTWAKGFTSGIYQNNPLPREAARDRNNIQEHVVVASYIVEIPNVSAKLGGSRPVSWLLDNWRVSGITTMATGDISNVTASYSDSFNFSGGGENCGNLIQTGNARLPRDERTIDRWFDTSVFQRPSGRGQIGNNCDNDKITLPGWHNYDLTLFKDITLRGTQKVQFRWEIYNLFNSLQFQDVDTTAQFDANGNQTDTNFGKVTSARTERRMVFGLRYSF